MWRTIQLPFKMARYNEFLARFQRKIKPENNHYPGLLFIFQTATSHIMYNLPKIASLEKILLFGAGKSASVLIDYLLSKSSSHSWKLVIADADKKMIESKTNHHPNSEAVGLDITDDEKRRELISTASIVISMMPPSLHILVAKDCIQFGKNLLTASYADNEILSLQQQVKDKGILFLCEMGLDPGIDHMSAMQLLDEIKETGGTVSSFKSHCGGLIAPESDDNPWHYKITWNPRNIVLAGKAGAVYRQDGKEVTEKYEDLFDANRNVLTGDNEVPALSYYPNRNSLPYIELYGLEKARTFIRTTLRYPDFMIGWKKIISLKLTDETAVYDTDGKSFAAFFSEHFSKWGIDIDSTLHGIEKTQLQFLGLEDKETTIDKGLCSAADVLQLLLEKKLCLRPSDKDMIVMLHEIEYLANDGTAHSIHSSLLVKGDDHIHTAMAKTVGLPLGIAAKLILEKKIQLTGIHIPVIKEIYTPLLTELSAHGITFHEARKSA